MPQDFGNGVSRTLSAEGRQYQLVVWQYSKPPLDSELNLMASIDLENQANEVRSSMHSGWLLDPFHSDMDFVTDKDNSNWFSFGRPGDGTPLSPMMWANVNGWIIPVTGSNSLLGDADISNRINLYAPPTSDSRVDFIFLEVFLAQVASNPSTANKPTASTVWKYGNVLYGGTNLPDEFEDPTIGFETTERVQIQYRLRVFGQGAGLGQSVDLASFPDGLDDPNILAQGTSTAPVVGFTYENMLYTLGDPSLWRAGDGDPTNELSTVDGYSYAIPVAAIFRRNTASFVAVTAAGNANQNGALDRNPNSAPVTDPVEGTRTFGPLTLTSAFGFDGAGDPVTGPVQVEGLVGSGYDNVDIDWASTFLVIDGEIIGIDAVNPGVIPGTINIRAVGGRGRFGTQISRHEAGAEIGFFNFRPDAKFADEIAQSDILDLRKGVTSGEWDYQALLRHNLGKLFKDSLRTSYKQSGVSDTEGAVVLEVDALWAGGTAHPNQTEALDGPDGIRTVFSDAAVVQNNVSVILNPTTGGVPPVTVASYTAGAASWDVAAEFVPAGFQSSSAGWDNQTVIQLWIGGATGNGGARRTVRDSDNRVVRFVAPREYWLNRDELSTPLGGTSGDQTPFKLRFLEEGWSDPAAADEDSADHPGPVYPLPEHNFELPFIVLGGVVNSALRSTTVQILLSGGVPIARFAGLNFDTAGSWYPTGDLTSLATTGVTNLLLYGQRNLYDMLTAGGTDRSGYSSELYLVLTGDTTNKANAGVFRVIGVGTAGMTTANGLAATDLVLQRVGQGSSPQVAVLNLTGEVRSQYMHTQDGDIAGDGASTVVVLTDMAGTAIGTSSPWGTLLTLPSDSQAILDTAVLYGPSRGGTARVASHLSRVAMTTVSTAQMVREPPSVLDPLFNNESGVADAETYFPLQHVQTWNRLPSLGLSSPIAPDYGDGKFLVEQRRDSEVFVDAGSKTLVVRPFQRTDLCMMRHHTDTTNELIPTAYTAGASIGLPTDGGGLFDLGLEYGYSVPPEFMPRFGRQDIPVHQTTGTTGPVYVGVNHIFGDSQTTSDDVFRVLGGNDSSTTVTPIYFQTGATSGKIYGEFYTLALTAQGYQAQLYEDVNVISSDLPRGLRGIQLPPFLGIGRLYGVYDLREFTGLGAFNSDRVTPANPLGRPKNLLRMDADKQTLFIVKGGGSPVTGNANDHTYVIPENVINIGLSGAYVTGETFMDLEYVVECEVFGFARGFINQNNTVLCRRNLPTTAASGNDGTDVGTPSLATSVSFILPLPLPYLEQLYVVYDRTVYQGDPYMTRDGATRTVSDYETRYGQIPAVSSSKLALPIQQFDSTLDYVQVPQIVNARSLEVLASIDFYTTLGTGKIGGPVYAGTPLDVGHIQGQVASRIAADPADPIFQMAPRTFTQPVDGTSSVASLNIQVLTSTVTSAGEVVKLTRGKDSSVSLLSGTDFIGASATLAAQALATAINASLVIRNTAQVYAEWDGGTTVSVISLLNGADGNLSAVELVAGSAGSPTLVVGFSFSRQVGQQRGTPYSQNRMTRSYLLGGVDLPMNGKSTISATTPIGMAGLTERLPLGILLQDADFLGEDPVRDGVSALNVSSGGSVSSHRASPTSLIESYGRLEGNGHIGMADGGVLLYEPWSLTSPGGTKKFRIFRGGGSAYVLEEGIPGGPVDWNAGGFSDGDDPVLKGALLTGRALLVRNYKEEAYALSEVRSYGDELQMVILTSAVLGDGAACEHGYTLDGQISPTGWGDGLAASDRYRLEGKPQANGHSKAGPSPVVPLAPYPSTDPSDPNPC